LKPMGRLVWIADGIWPSSLLITVMMSIHIVNWSNPSKPLIDRRVIGEIPHMPYQAPLNRANPVHRGLRSSVSPVGCYLDPGGGTRQEKRAASTEQMELVPAIPNFDEADELHLEHPRRRLRPRLGILCKPSVVASVCPTAEGIRGGRLSGSVAGRRLRSTWAPCSLWILVQDRGNFGDAGGGAPPWLVPFPRLMILHPLPR
jgi:hypothetical protein